MKQVWSVVLYESREGESPVEDFITSLDVKTQVKIARTIEHLEEFGPALGSPHLKKMTGTTLWELRILGGDSIRIFYVLITGKAFLLLHGFKKKKQKTPQKEIKTAELRYKEFINRR